jgi:hypothetical protein
MSLGFFSRCVDVKEPVPDHVSLAREHFDNDYEWYVDNIPFFECADKQLEDVYYYRWKMYKAHIRNTGNNQYVITEFINHVSWDREPFCTINAASMHHIYEGRWLKDDRYMNSYIDYLYNLGGNDRRYSESVADATYARYLMNGDSEFITSLLDSMISVYNGWYDHWDSTKQMYYIPAMPDATEYTIASIDASGGKDGFEGGDAFRPTINSYMYGNALAISKIAALKKDLATSERFGDHASHLKNTVEKNLWNDSLNHFIDRYKVDNQYVHYWDFIRGRELAGMAPWYFNLPSDDKKFHKQWKHVTDTTHLLGKYGFRTNEPAYEFYFHQFLWHEGKRGSQWNGPSWPYQSSQTLTGMANVLQRYNQDVITSSDYLKLLRLYAQQHYLPNGKINLVENYDPNLGGPIVHYYWSNHYNHSSYNNLILAGLCGIQPEGGDSLTIHPLVDSSIPYFRVSELMYHGHRLTILYDEDGSKYGLGKGVNVFVDGKKAEPTHSNGKYRVHVGKTILPNISKEPINHALNIRQKDFPKPSASVNALPDSVYFAVDGRTWYFTEVHNRWTTSGSTSLSDWFQIDFGTPKEITTVKVYPVDDGQKVFTPDSIKIEYSINNTWKVVTLISSSPKTIAGNRPNVFSFQNVNTSMIRIHFSHEKNQIAISEIECF